MKEEKTTGRLRFKDDSGNDFPDWEEKRLGEIFTFRSTNSFSRDNLNYEEGSVKNIHYGDIHTRFRTHFNILKEVVPYVNENISLKKLPEESFCKEGDLIIADASEDYEDIGKSIEIVNLNNEKVISGLHTLHARPDLQKVVIGFCGHLMKSENVRFQIKTLAQGTKVLSITTGRISDISIDLPSLAEQTKIANFLSAIDEKIENLEKELDELKAYKKGVMQAIFNEDDQTQMGGGKLLIFNNLRNIRFKDNNGNDFPAWKISKLGEICEIFDGTHQTPDYTDVGIPFYSVEHVTSNNFTKTKFISKDVFEKENTRVKLEKGDILMTRIGDVGTAKYIDWDVMASFYVSLVLIKKPMTNNNEFIYHFINSDFFQTELHQRTIHVAFPKKINLGEIGNCLIKLPCVEEQTKIANFLSAVDNKINHCSNQIDETKQYKQGLLQQLFVELQNN